ncbi:MAG: hypothetical protein ACREPB_07790 [Arenimonas sp.]
MSIWQMASVEHQPRVTLVRRRALRLSAHEKTIDLVLGWYLEDHHARMSTPIKHHDVQARTLVTKSGREYSVAGDSEYCDDAEYVLEQHFGPTASTAIDVSAEYIGGLLKQASENNHALDY